jgi:hypothetical protein
VAAANIFDPRIATVSIGGTHALVGGIVEPADIGVAAVNANNVLAILAAMGAWLSSEFDITVGYRQCPFQRAREFVIRNQREGWLRFLDERDRREGFPGWIC